MPPQKQSIFDKICKTDAWHNVCWLFGKTYVHVIGIILTYLFHLSIKLIIEYKDTIGLAIKNIGDVLSLRNHWIEGSLVFSFILLYYLTRRVIRHWRRGSAASAAGLFYCSVNSNTNMSKKSEKFLKRKSLFTEKIFIIGATGWNTFGHENTPLYQSIINCQNARLILMDPGSPFVRSRASSLKLNTITYINEIQHSLKLLKEIKASHPEKNIEVKLYNGYPVWKAIFLDNYVWLWQYPSDKQVNMSPCFGFEKINRENSGMYSQLMTHFNMYWQVGRLVTYDLLTGNITGSYESCPIPKPPEP